MELRRGVTEDNVSRAHASDSGTPATVLARLRGESGQGVVEFAMVVPLLCVLVLVFVDFAKAMNYWLDLNHVAMEGARKAAVNTYPTAGDYQTYVRDRLETNELKSGGTDAVPTAADIAICLPDGGDVGDPVTVQVKVDYDWIPFIASGAFGIKGTATMRLEQKADFSAVGTCT
jgi:Flp pilus assembly protein TadG